ncbi:hypothetical protein N7497_003686, partial [Penicillium chrysogenum]
RLVNISKYNKEEEPISKYSILSEIRLLSIKISLFISVLAEEAIIITENYKRDLYSKLLYLL